MFDERMLAVAVLPFGLLAGLAFPQLAAAAEPYGMIALFLVVVFSMLPFARQPLSELFNLDVATTRTTLWQQIVLPAIMIAAGVLARFPDHVIVLMIVTACAGSLFASPALAELLQLDRRRALQGMVLSTLVMPVSLLVFLTIFQGDNVHLDFAVYAKRTLCFLALPFALFVGYRKVAATLSASASARVEFGARWGAVLSLIVFGVSLMRVVSDEIAIAPMRVLFFLVVVSLLCVCMLLLTVVVMHRFGLGAAMTAGILAGFRNVGLGFALVGDMIGPELAVYVGVSMLPVFTAPLLLRLATVSRESAEPRAA